MALAATFYFSRLPQRPVLLAHLRFFQHCLGRLLALGPVLNRQFATFALIRIAANRALLPPGFHLKVLEACPDCRIRSLMLMAALPLIFLGFSALSSYCPYSNDTPCVFSLPADVPYRIDPSVPKQAAQCKRRLSFTDMPLIGSQPRRERSHIQRAATRDLLTCPSRAFGPSPETSSHLANPRRSSRSGGSRMRR